MDSFAGSVGRDMGLRILDFLPPGANGRGMVTGIGTTLLEPFIGYLDTDSDTLLACLHAIDTFYWTTNPYHNGIHAANVAHMVCCILNAMGLATVTMELEKTAVVIAALGHDIAHPGRTNNFFVNTNSILALVQNDTAVLEATHSALLQVLIASR